MPKNDPNILIIIQEEMASVSPITAKVIVFLAFVVPSLSLPAESRLKPPTTIITKEATPINPSITDRKFPTT